MSHLLGEVKLTFEMNHYLFGQAIKGLSEDTVAKRPNDQVNPMLWIAGHLVHERCFLLSLLGEESEVLWAKEFGRGSKLREIADYPSWQTILEEWEKRTTSLMPLLDTVSENILLRITDLGLPFSNATVARATTFLAMHESYHIGQMGYLRKLLGEGSALKA